MSRRVAAVSAHPSVHPGSSQRPWPHHRCARAKCVACQQPPPPRLMVELPIWIESSKTMEVTCEISRVLGLKRICGEMDCSRKIFEVLLLTKITLVCLRVVSDLPLRGSNLFREKRSLALFELFVIYISKQNNSPKLWYLQPSEMKHWKRWCLDASPSAPCPINVSLLAKKLGIIPTVRAHFNMTPKSNTCFPIFCKIPMVLIQDIHLGPQNYRFSPWNISEILRQRRDAGFTLTIQADGYHSTALQQQRVVPPWRHGTG